MDEVFAIALHRVIVPQRIAGDFVIEVDDEEESDSVTRRLSALRPRSPPLANPAPLPFAGSATVPASARGGRRRKFVRRAYVPILASPLQPRGAFSLENWRRQRPRTSVADLDRRSPSRPPSRPEAAIAGEIPRPPPPTPTHGRI